MIGELPRVSRYEADLLTILQGFLGYVPRSQLLSLLSSGRERPKCLSRAAVELIQDTLAKGATRRTAEAGWQTKRFLSAGAMVEGRVWQRLSPAQSGLDFSPQTLDFLLWATATDCLKPTAAIWKPLARRKLTLGDRWFLTTAMSAVHDSDPGRLWAQREPWRSDPLSQLWFAADFEPGTPGKGAAAKPAELDFESWLRPAGLAVIEAEESWLARRWIEMERAKARVVAPGRLQAIGASQARVLDAWLTAIEQAGRRDLSRFLLAAVATLLREKPTLKDWFGQVEVGEIRLADRQTTYRSALVVLQAFQRLVGWQAEARGVGYFDEGYQAAQLWKADWEAYNGDSLAATARGLLDQSQRL